MSIATGVRAYADVALEQGKSALSQAGTAVVKAPKRLATEAPKPVLAALGVADLVADALGKQAETLGRQAGDLGKRVESLPAEAVGNVVKAQETSLALLSRTQDDAMARLTELRGRLDTGVDTVRALPQLSVVAASTTTVYLSNARQVFGKLTARGEARLADLRKAPGVSRLLGEVDEAGAAVVSRFDSVRSDVVVPYLEDAVDAMKDADLGEPAPRRRASTRRSTESTSRPAARTSPRKAADTTASRTRTAPAAKSTAPAAKSTARKAPAAKSTARKAAGTTTPARKAPAKNTTARKAAAKKA